MTATAHALVGAAFAASIPDPRLGLTLATLSHPIMDLIPHWDVANNWRQKTKLNFFLEASLDLGIGVILSYLLFGQNISLTYFLAAVFLAEAWDILEAPYWFLRWKFFPFGFIYKIQHNMQSRAKLPLGLITQVITVAGVILLSQYIAQI